MKMFRPGLPPIYVDEPAPVLLRQPVRTFSVEEAIRSAQARQDAADAVATTMTQHGSETVLIPNLTPSPAPKVNPESPHNISVRK